MATTTQYNPDPELNRRLLGAGVSKTIYALVTPETEAAKAAELGDLLPDGRANAARADYLQQYREAWTGKQDQTHVDFFEAWRAWSAPLVDLDRAAFAFLYPTSGASEPLRHLIQDYGNIARAEGFTPRVHVFAGEYEGYRAYAESARIECVAHDRRRWEEVARDLPASEWFFLSQPSAIDGDVWPDANRFLRALSRRGEAPQVVVDLTYVGAIARAPAERFDVGAPCVRNVVFSLSKAFGVYYDRIGGVWSRQEDLGLFGNKWFKNLFSLRLGTRLMRSHGVFDLPNKYAALQGERTRAVGRALGVDLRPADVFILASAAADAFTDERLRRYLSRAPADSATRLRLCLTAGMAEVLGTGAAARRVTEREERAESLV